MVSTFLPYPDMMKSCQSLDGIRLGKQRSEIKIILAALTGVRFKKWAGEFGVVLGPKRGYQNHSVSRMWIGHEWQLAELGRINCEVWAERFGHPLTLGSKGYDTWVDMVNWKAWMEGLPDYVYPKTLPGWWGDERVHSSHRSVLLSKDIEWYGQFDWKEEPVYEYFWPV